MSKLREAVQAALEALEWIEPSGLTGRGGIEARGKAIDALRAALAEPEQEPVAWLYTLEYGSSVADTKVSTHQLRYPFGVCGADYLRANDDGVSYVLEVPLYAAPPSRKPRHVSYVCPQCSWSLEKQE